MGRRGQSIVGKALLAWWVVAAILIPIAGGAYLMFRALSDGLLGTAAIFALPVGGGCWYLYRTLAARSEIAGLLKD